MYEYELDVTPGGIPVQVNLSQYDQDYELRFRLYSRNGALDIRPGTAVGIRGTKRDGNGYSVNAAISGSVVTVSGDQQMTAVAGKQFFELTLTDAGKELNTANFTVNVERAALDKDTLGSESVIRELVSIADRTDEIIAAADKADTAKTEIRRLSEAAVAADADARVQARIAAEAAQSAVASQRNAEKDVSQAKETALEEIGETYRSNMESINKKGAEIARLTTNADQVAKQALEKASNAENEVAESSNAIESLKKSGDAMKLLLEGKVDGAYVENGYLYLTSSDEIVAGPLGPFSGTGGGSGGTGGNNAELSVTNVTGWLSRTIANGDSCVVKVNWSSVEDGMPTGNGSMKITVNGVVKAIVDIAQGEASADISKYLTVGSNVVKVNVADVYNNNRTINFSVTSIAISISSTFDASIPYQGAISFPFTPVGSVQKTVKFLLDGREIGSTVTSVSGRQMSFTIPQQAHGGHIFQAYFECDINGQTVKSNELYYEIVCLEALNETPIIASNFGATEKPQYAQILIPYLVYLPNSLTAEIELKVNGQVVSKQTVDRTQQLWSYRADAVGSLTLQIVCGDVVKTFSLTITESDIDVEAETENLSLYLSSSGRSNNEENPAEWKSGSTNVATFEGFNWSSDGWIQDSAGLTTMRVGGDARLTIGYKPFASDFRITGKTIELEFATHDVMNYDSPIISCMQGGRGFSITSQLARLTSEQSSIEMQFKEDERVRLSFVVEKRAEQRLIYIYINGIMSGCVRYPSDDDFAQVSPINISVGSSDAVVDLYTVRIYDNDLTRHQVLTNWIADTQDLDDMIARYTSNSVFDEYSSIVIGQLPADLPYLILEGPELPQYKGDKKIVGGSYVDPVNRGRSFTFSGAQIDVQGTSSQYYARKNYKLKLKEGYTTNSGAHADKYAMNDDAIPTDIFCFKADVASSEGCNNVELVRIYNSACPYKTPPQKANPKVRQGIDGFPMVVFWNDGTHTEFIGKYNFNNDKSSEEVFGFAEGDESWEIKNNTSNRVLFKDADFGGSDFLNDFEGRYPDGSEDGTELQKLVAWIASTDQGAATGSALSAAVSYGGKSYTTDTAAYRLAKFKAELSQHMEVDAVVFYYLFTELYLMVDSRAKNAFPSHIGGDKWFSLPYDFDTAIGINNEGTLAFSYNLEDIDKTETGADVFNGQQSVLWINLRAAFYPEITAMYQSLRSTGKLSYELTEAAFEAHQAKWPAAIFNEDAYFKYLAPLIEQGNASYLSMLQGSKEQQRKWWFYNRFRYMDSKYNAGDALTDVISVRGYAKSDVSITPYADVYASVKFGSYLVQTRAARNQSYTLACPLTSVNDTEIYVYSASQLKSVGDLSGLKVGYADFSNATKLQELKLGDASSSYSNTNLQELHMGNNRLLKKIDVRNSPNLTSAVDLSGCKNIEEIYFEGTAITGLQLPNGGTLKTLHVPGTMANLTVRNQRQITDFQMPLTDGKYPALTTLWLENSSIDAMDMIGKIEANTRLRLIGISWEFESADAISDFYDILDTMRGLDEQGNNMERPQISGKLHVSDLTGAEMAALQARYPTIQITFDHIKSYCYFYNYDGTTLLYTASCLDGADAVYSGSTPSRSSTAQYTYAFAGWAKTPNGSAVSNALVAVTADRSVYAAFTATVRKYTVYFYNGSTLLQTVQNVAYGSSATYTGETPAKTGVDKPEDYEFSGWSPSPTNIQGNTSCYAQFTFTGFIQDDWDVIAANVENGSFKSVYGVGGVKELTLTWGEGNEETIAVEIADFEHDDLADGSGKAGISFIAQNLLAKSERMNGSNTNKGGWTLTNIRTYCNSDVFNALPANLQSAIKEVSKISDAGERSQILKTTIDKVWIPSYEEVVLSGSTNIAIGQGEPYPIFTANSSRRRANFGTTSYRAWWLRSTHTLYTGYFWNVSSSGYSENCGAFSSNGVLPCFCIGKSHLLSDTWEEILAAEADGTYKEKYAIGDQKEVELTWSDGTTEKVVMEIADFDHDDLADGSGKAKISWIARNVLSKNKVMKYEGDNTDGWTLSVLRTYCNGDVFNALPENLRNAIKEVTKKCDGGGADAILKSVNDRIWIPSCTEVGYNDTSSVISQGTKYPIFAHSNISRQRAKFGTISNEVWWTISADIKNNHNFYCIHDSGGFVSRYANIECSVLPCFCT